MNVTATVTQVKYEHPWTSVTLIAWRRKAEGGHLFDITMALYSDKVGGLDNFMVGREVAIEVTP